MAKEFIKGYFIGSFLECCIHPSYNQRTYDVPVVSSAVSSRNDCDCPLILIAAHSTAPGKGNWPKRAMKTDNSVLIYYTRTAGFGSGK